MSQFDPELLEKELRKLEPAKAPEEFVRRVTEAARESAFTPRSESQSRYQSFCWWQRLRWLAPAAVAAAVLLSLLAHKPEPQPQTRLENGSTVSSPKPVLKADLVEIDEQLVASFDAVARLPDGVPVRLRCREWRDEVVLHDSARGVTIERQSPRLEVTPVRYDIY